MSDELKTGHNAGNNLEIGQDAGDNLEVVNLHLKPVHSDATPSYYSNVVNVTRSPYDVCIDFCLASSPQKLSRDGEIVTLSVPVIVQVVLPTAMAENLAQLITSQVQIHRAGVERGVGDIEIESVNPLEEFLGGEDSDRQSA